MNRFKYISKYKKPQGLIRPCSQWKKKQGLDIDVPFAITLGEMRLTWKQGDCGPKTPSTSMDEEGWWELLGQGLYISEKNLKEFYEQV